MSEEQAATQTDEKVMPSSEDKGEQDLDSLLKEFEEDEPKKSSEEDKKKPDDFEDLRAFKDEYTREKTRNELSKVVQNIKGDLKFNDKLVRGFLEAEAAENPAVAKAFVNRHKNPDAWKKIEDKFHRDLKTMQDSFGDKSSEAKRKVMDAVRNINKTPASETADFSKMSDREFEQWKKSQSGWAG